MKKTEAKVRMTWHLKRQSFAGSSAYVKINEFFRNSFIFALIVSALNKKNKQLKLR